MQREKRDKTNKPSPTETIFNWNVRGWVKEERKGREKWEEQWRIWNVRSVVRDTGRDLRFKGGDERFNFGEKKC